MLQLFIEARPLESARHAPYFFLAELLEIMLAKCENIGDAVKSFIAGLWIALSVCSVCVRGQEGKKTPVMLTLLIR